jgi:hypothetical protein
MPTLNLTAIAVAIGVLLLSSIGSFFYGRSTGFEACQAKQAVALSQGFKDLEKSGKDQQAADQKSFDARMARLDGLAGKFSTQGDQINGAASRLSASLAARPSVGGSCNLTPGDRRLLECIRRPFETGCATP